MVVLKLTKNNEVPEFFNHVTEIEESWRHRGVEKEQKEVWRAFDPEVDYEPTYIGCDFGYNKDKYGLMVFSQNCGNIEILKKWQIEFIDPASEVRWDVKKMLKKTGKIKNKYNKPENEWIMKFLKHKKGAKWYRI